MRMTMQERAIRFLTEAFKAREVEGKSKKYRQLKTENTNYFVGRNGAVRAGENSSNSVSMTGYVHKLMNVWERKNNISS